MPGLEKPVRKINIGAIACRVFVIFAIGFFISLLIYSVCLHFKQIWVQKKADGLVHEEIIKVMGARYETDQPPVRWDTVLIIYNVFCDLDQKGFENIKGETKRIGQAIKLGIVDGDGEKDFRLGDPTTKEASLAFIGRSLNIMDDKGVVESPDFLKSIQFNKWARAQIVGLVRQGYLGPSDIIGLNDLRDNITAAELEELLDKIVEVKAQPMDLGELIFFVLEDNPSVYLVTLLLAVFANVVTLWGSPKKRETNG